MESISVPYLTAKIAYEKARDAYNAAILTKDFRELHPFMDAADKALKTYLATPLPAYGIRGAVAVYAERF